MTAQELLDKLLKLTPDELNQEIVCRENHGILYKQFKIKEIRLHKNKVILENYSTK